MKHSIALIFGYNDYAIEIEKNIKTQYEEVYIFKLGEDDENSFDLSDNWDSLSKKVNIDTCTAFCILEDMAENVFLTISLRDTFKDLDIIALSLDKESQDKLILAGATNVLPTMQTTANVIVDLLEKPVVTKVLHDILYKSSSLKIAQIKVENSELFEQTHPTDIKWSRDHGIVIIFLVHENNTREFINTSRAVNHRVKNGDIFIVVGYDSDIKAFEKLIGCTYEE